MSIVPPAGPSAIEASPPCARAIARRDEQAEPGSRVDPRSPAGASRRSARRRASRLVRRDAGAAIARPRSPRRSPSRRRRDRDRGIGRRERRRVLDQLSDHERDLGRVDGRLEPVGHVDLERMIAGLGRVRARSRTIAPRSCRRMSNRTVPASSFSARATCSTVRSSRSASCRIRSEELATLAVVEPVVVRERRAGEPADRRDRPADLVRQLRDEGGSLLQDVALVPLGASVTRASLGGPRLASTLRRSGPRPGTCPRRPRG